MPSRDHIDLPTRQRIAAYLRWAWKNYEASLRALGEEATRRDFATKLGIHEGTVSNILTGKTDGGFDIALAMNRRLRMSADDLLNVDPPPEHYVAMPARRAARTELDPPARQRSPRHAVARSGSIR